MKPAARRPVPDPLEWDFSGVPESDLELCFYYEQAREAVAAGLFSAPSRALVEQWRTAERIAGAYSTRSAWLFAEGFPELSWARISANDVRRLREMLAPPAVPLGLLVEDDFVSSVFDGWPGGERPDPEDQDEVDLFKPKFFFNSAAEQASFAVIRIDWRQSKREVKRQFEQLLSNIPCTGSTGGRDSFRDKLNGLTALRLTRLCKTAVDALAIFEDRVARGPFSDERSFRRAARRAKTLLLAEWEH